MGCCYIFGAAPIDDYSYINIKLNSDDYVICADGGYRHAKRLSLAVDAVIGDFDSDNKPEDEFVIEYPAKKDDTDMMLAVKAGLAAGYKRFKIYGALGGRFDHSLANLSVLLYLNRHSARGTLFDKRNTVYALSDSQSIKLTKKDGYKISLLPFSQSVTGIFASGVSYPLENAELTNSFPLGVSNEFAAASAEISIKSGDLAVVLSRD